ncbi:MAG: GH116 family glycosyl hydrolase, partial [Terriglobales bacterium]
WGGVVGAAIGGYEITAGTEMAMPTPGYQTTTNGPCYVDMIDRYLQRTGDQSVFKEFYDSAKRNTIYTMQLNPEGGGDGIISVPKGNVDPENPSLPPGFHLEWFESVLWFGMTPHVGGIHLANLKMTERMAEAVGDKEFAGQCRSWFEQGSRSMEKKLWTGSYYLTYKDEKLGKQSDDVFAYQLDGEWMAKFHGLPGVFQPDRVKTALGTIKRACIDRWKFGAVNLARPDGELSQGVGYGPNAFFVPEVYMLAMTYIYAGERDFGLELARRCVYSLNIHNLLTWDQPNLLRADTGDLLFGSHYVQNMMLWALPAALEGKDIASFCAPGGLVDRVVKAAKSGSAA